MLAVLIFLSNVLVIGLIVTNFQVETCGIYYLVF